MEPRQGEYVVTADDANRLIREVDRDNVGTTLDVAHIPWGTDEVAFIGALERIVHVHLSDADEARLHLPLGEGSRNLVRVLAALREYEGAHRVRGPLDGRRAWSWRDGTRRSSKSCGGRRNGGTAPASVAGRTERWDVDWDRAVTPGLARRAVFSAVRRRIGQERGTPDRNGLRVTRGRPRRATGEGTVTNWRTGAARAGRGARGGVAWVRA